LPHGGEPTLMMTVSAAAGWTVVPVVVASTLPLIDPVDSRVPP
jgi:hypothetical protein